MYRFHPFLLFHLLTCLNNGQNALGSEIINGRNAPKNSMQFMASVQANTQHVCGGFLVSEDFVVTAAHCGKQNLTRVVLGTHNLTNVPDDAVIKIKQRFKHPLYKKPELGYDIMLLQLSEKARLDSKIVKKIQLPKSNNKIKNMGKCNVAGWGFTKTKGEAVDVLKVVDVPIINLDECKRKWKNVRSLPDNIICAGGSGTNKGFCKGDSGGPLVCNGMAVGVVSFNKYNCDYPNWPNIYTDISKHIAWIKDILKKKEL
ncbi:Mast cell protease 1A [Channa argus]|uniref:Mast cell protease 1A n=1 Tax=Channa argus TaxID=215402 RepID=A0A6G1PL91_CHAAH|nr:Mast cell protease 1A [Channa argus]